MTSSVRLSIPDSIYRASSVLSAPPARKALIDVRDRAFGEGSEIAGLTGVAVMLGEHELLKMTYLDPDGLTDLEAQVAAFNADPDRAWQELFACFASSHLQTTARNVRNHADLASQIAGSFDAVSPFTYLNATTEWADSITQGQLDIRPAIATESQGRLTVTLDVGMAELDDPITLWEGAATTEYIAAIGDEVAVFNQDPAASFRTIIRQGLITRQRKRATKIATLARKQNEEAALIGALI